MKKFAYIFITSLIVLLCSCNEVATGPADTPTAIILIGVGITQCLRHIVVVDVGVVLGDDTLDSGLWQVVLAVGILIASNLAISDTQCEVCIGEEGTLLIPLHQRLDIGAEPALDVGDVAEVAVGVGADTLLDRCHSIDKLRHRVALDSCEVEALDSAQLGVVVEPLGIALGATVSLEESLKLS